MSQQQQQQQNLTPLYLQDSNGVPQYMFKVVNPKHGTGNSQQPQQQKTIYRSINTDQSGGGMSNFAAGTILQASKLPNGQLVAMPRAQGVNQSNSVMRPIVVPVSSIQQVRQGTALPKTQQRQFTQIVRPFVIRTQTGNGTSSNNSNIIKATNVRSGVLHTSVQQIQLQQQKSKVKVETDNSSNGNPQQAIKFQQIPQQAKSLPQQAANPASPSKTLLTTPILDHSGGRKRQEMDFDYNVENKRRKTEKGGKGLRHFSMKVCEKVKAKGRTSYNEVADELVAEFCDPNRSINGEVSDDQKNIRRRVYDALNVLMAMDIISKEKKEIQWLGLPTNTAQECLKLEDEKEKRKYAIEKKREELHHLILQQIAFKRLIARNIETEMERGPPPPNTTISLPFVVMTTGNTTTIDCSIASDKTEYLFNYDGKVDVHEDGEMLRKMGLTMGLDKGECTDEGAATATALLPKSLEGYVEEMRLNPPAEKTVVRDELVNMLGGVALPRGEFGKNVGGGGGMIEMEARHAIGGALGGVRNISTSGGVLLAKVSPALENNITSPESSLDADSDIDANI